MIKLKSANNQKEYITVNCNQVGQYQVRYGSNYKVILSIVLPSLLTIYPFILLMKALPKWSDFIIYLIIFLFLFCLIMVTLWLTLSVYPKVILSIARDGISVSFLKRNVLTPPNFTIKFQEIKNVSFRTIADYKAIKNLTWLWRKPKGDPYMLFLTSVKPSRFQISAASYNDEDQLSFESAVMEIREMISRKR